MFIEVHTAFVARQDKFGSFAEATGYVLEDGKKLDSITLVGDTAELAVCDVLEEIVRRRRERCDADPDAHVEHGKITAAAVAALAF